MNYGYTGYVATQDSDEVDITDFLRSLGFLEDEIFSVVYELNSYRTIPGTTLERYINRVVSSIVEDERISFLKGLLVGIAIRQVVDTIQDEEEPPLSDEEALLLEELRRLS